MSFRITNETKNRFEINDGSLGFRIVDSYKNKNAKNDGKEGFRITNNFKGNDEMNEDAFSFIAKLVANDAQNSDRFGYSVAVSDNLIVVGAFINDLPSGGSDQGSVYVYDANTRAFLTQLTANDAQNNDRFGYSVAVSNSLIVVGAYGNDLPSGGADQGSVYVYDANTRAFLTQLTANDAQNDDLYGYSVAVSNNLIVVGALMNDLPSGGGNQGSVYVYDANTRAFLTQLTANDAQNSDRFGYSVAVSDNLIVVGAFINDLPSGGSDQGSVYVYDANTRAFLTQLTANDAQNSDQFGCSVAVSNSLIVVGAYGNDLPSGGSDQGSVYVYDANTRAFLTQLTANDAQNDDLYGYSVAVSNNLIVVGAYGNDSSKGSVYVYNSS